MKELRLGTCKPILEGYIIPMTEEGLLLLLLLSRLNLGCEDKIADCEIVVGA